MALVSYPGAGVPPEVGLAPTLHPLLGRLEPGVVVDVADGPALEVLLESGLIRRVVVVEVADAEDQASLRRTRRNKQVSEEEV